MKIIIGSNDRFRHIEHYAVKSILRFSTFPKEDIKIVRTSASNLGQENQGLQETGCTGFTNVRYLVPEICGFSGIAVYIDVDMFLFADVWELFRYAVPGKWVCLADGSTEVSVIDCACVKPGSINYQTHKSILELCLPKLLCIPEEWNHEDKYIHGETKILHFTDLKRQPWFFDGHPYAHIWEQIKTDLGPEE